MELQTNKKGETSLKEIGYYIVRFYIKLNLYFFHKKIQVSGLEHIPKNKPVLFLPNHQNALIDALLIAVDCKRKPYFLTRSDVFATSFLKKMFHFFKMIPVFRMRDGRNSLKNNEAIFNTCANLLCNNEAVLIFPEANHSLLRRVRPLSKGFTRIIFTALRKNPKLDLQIVPVGLNYKEATHFPDQVAICFGEPISVSEWYKPESIPDSITEIKSIVSSKLKRLTTHIDSELNYSAVISKLQAENTNFLNPEAVNQRVEKLAGMDTIEKKNKQINAFPNLFRLVFDILNFPVVFLWRKVMKPKAPEDEFVGTFRFVFALVTFPLYYVVLFFSIGTLWDWYSSIFLIIIIGLYNYLYVKLAK